MFVSIKKVLQKGFWQNPRTKKGLEFSQAKELWQKISKRVLGEKVSSLIRPIYLNKGVLAVLANNHFAAQEARLKEEEIKKEINSFLRTKILKKIVYKTGGANWRIKN